MFLQRIYSSLERWRKRIKFRSALAIFAIGVSSLILLLYFLPGTQIFEGNLVVE